MAHSQVHGPLKRPRNTGWELVARPQHGPSYDETWPPEGVRNGAMTSADSVVDEDLARM
jgi:hypothetical protein